MNRSFQSFRAHGHENDRTAYEFMEASRQQGRKDRSVAIRDMEIDERDSEADDNDMDDVPWAPTGIFAVFVITLWTAVLKLIDSIDNNGPVVCSEGEEVRLWICSGCLSLIFFLAEIVWKGKNFTKALFGAVLVFAYMMLGHTEPLTCRLGQAKLNEINKWQAAMNFFFGALLGTKVYQEIAEAIRLKRKSKGKKQRRKRKADDSSDEDESVMRILKNYPTVCAIHSLNIRACKFKLLAKSRSNEQYKRYCKVGRVSVIGLDVGGGLRGIPSNQLRYSGPVLRTSDITFMTEQDGYGTIIAKFNGAILKCKGFSGMKRKTCVIPRSLRPWSGRITVEVSGPSGGYRPSTSYYMGGTPICANAGFEGDNCNTDVPKITSPPTKVTVMYGSSVTLSCQHQASGPVTVAWQLGNKVIAFQQTNVS
ncbi:hypothetical protein QZH41_006618 [Actinostola sp. cb2023]|nr:hypothetical protein QZH41_006618 [Actinostola sp. cb2023]